jgi:hypothetical protein
MLVTPQTIDFSIYSKLANLNKGTQSLLWRERLRGCLSSLDVPQKMLLAPEKTIIGKLPSIWINLPKAL